MSQKFLSPVALTGITDGSILKVNSSGVIVAAVDGTDYNTGSSQWTTSGNDIYYTTGNVGIGETSPDGLLHIKGSAQATEFYIESSTGTASTSGAIKIAQNNRSAEDFAGEMVFYVQDNNVGGTYWREAMAIINNGNVGIGNSSPGNNRLKVTGATEITGNLTLSGLGAGFLKTDASGAVSVDTSTYLTSYTESDTLDSVTDRGATTTNAITVGGLTVGDSHFIGNQTTYDNLLLLSSANENIVLSSAVDLYFNTGGTSAGAVGSSRMFISGTNGNIGIGTISPSSKLHLSDTTGGSIYMQDSNGATTHNISSISNNGNNFGIYTRSSDGTYVATDYQAVKNSSGTDYHRWFTNGDNERMRITSAGNVGIGTTSPSEKLDVNGTARISRPGSGVEYLNISVGDTLTTFTHTEDATDAGNGHGGFKFISNGALTGTNELFQIANAGGSVLLINSSGNVGIGTTSPENTLHVHKGSAGTVTANANSPIVIENSVNAYLNILVPDASESGILFGRPTSNVDGGIVYNSNISRGLEFRTAGNAYRMGIDSNGYVGIGTSSPMAKLTLPLEEESNYKIAFKSAGTTHAGISTVDQSGAGLYIAANSYVNSSGLITYNDSAYPSSGIYFDGWNQDAMMFYTAASGAPSERMRITSAGNVGIGTTSPNSLLHVNGSNPFVRINNSSVGDHGIKISYGNSDAHGLHLLYNPNSAISYIDNTYQAYSGQVYGNIYFRQNVSGTMTSRMMIKADGGNVGIGTTSPGFKLDVNGYIRANDRVYVRDSTKTLEVGSDYIQSYVTSGIGVSPIRFFTSTTEKARIDGNGNVGINTTAPEDKLHVLVTSTTAAQGIYLDSGSGNAGSAFLNVSTTDGPVLTGNTNTDGNVRGAYKASRIVFNGAGFKFQHSSETTGARTWSSHMVIDTDGKVGIGVGTPSTLLHVNGTITAPGVTTANNATVLDNTGIQPSQGTTEKTVVFKWSGTEIASLNNEGYFLASGYKTSGTTGYLKSDGTVDTSTFITSIPSEYVTDTELTTALGSYITVSSFNSATVFVLNGTDVGMGDDVTLGTAAFSASTDFATPTYVDTAISNLVDSAPTALNTLNELAAALGDDANFSTTVTTALGNRLRVDANQGLTTDQQSTGRSNLGLGTASTSNSGDFATAAHTHDWTQITSGDRTNYTLGFRAPTSSYAGFNFKGTDGNNAGYLLIRGTSDNDVYTAEGITLVADQGWLTLAQRYGTTNGIRFMTGSTASTRMVIANGGNVGIGTTSPSARLHVNGSAETLYLEGASNYTTAKFRYGGATKAEMVWSEGGGSLYWQTMAGGPIMFYQAGNERLRINTGGNVGIGTTSPSELLELQRDGKIGFGANGSYGIRTGYFDDGSGTHGFHIDTKHGGTWSTRRLVVRADSGNVGIGTDSPSEKLHVAGNIKTSGELIFDTSAASTTSTAKIFFGTVPSPDGSLNTGANNVSGYGVDNYGIILQAGYGESDMGGIKITDDGVMVWGASDENVFTVIDEDNNIVQFSIDNSGISYLRNSLGIGTTSPTAPLDVPANTSTYKVAKLGNDTTYHYTLTGESNHGLTLTCGSYYMAEVIITAQQTNGGGYNNLYIRGIWSNNYTSHHWDELENVGYLTGSSFTITNGQNGDTTNSGKLDIQMAYTSGSFSALVVRVVEMHAASGSHSYTIS